MAKIRRRRRRAMENCPIQKRKIENMKALMMQLACSDPSRLPYDDLIEEKIEMLMMRSLPDHPTYAAMIIGALQQLKEEEGSTEEAISSSISEFYDDLPLAHATFLKHHLKQLVQKEEIFRISGNRYMLIGSIARTELKESQEPKSKLQVEKIESQKQDFNAKGSAELNKESQGEEQANYAIDKQTEEQPGSTEECNKELRVNTDKIMEQTDAGKRMADESNDMSQHNNGAIKQQSQGLENPTEVITMEQTDAGNRMADELTNDKGQHNNRVIRQQSRGLQNRKEVIVATQEQSRPTCEATQILPPGEEIMQASDEQHHHEQQNDVIGYRNQLQDLKRLQEQQNDFYAKIIELYTIVENLKKSKEVDGPRTISSSSALTDLGVNQSCSLLFSTEEGLQLLWKVTGINHQLAEILNSSSLPKASRLASESVVGGQQRDLPANHSLLTTAPCQGPECNHICSRKSQDKCNQKRSYCRTSSMEYGMKTVTPDDVYTSQCQEKSPSQVSHSKRHLDSKKTVVNSFKRRKKNEFNAELLVETSVGRSDQVKVDQLGGNALVPSATGRPQTEEHLKNTETTERVTTRMQKKRSGVFKEPASTLVSEQLHQQREERKVSVPYSRRKRGPVSAVEDSLFLKDLFALKKRAKKDTKMKLKQLDREQQEEHEMIKMPQEQGMLVEDAVMFPDTVNETPERRRSATEISEKQQQAGEADPQACSEILGEKSFEEQRKRKRMKGLQQQRLLRSRAKRPSDSGVVEELASAEVQDEEHFENTESKDTTQSAGVSSPENLDEQNFQLRTKSTMPDKDDKEAGSPPTNPKRRGRPPGSLKGLKLKKKMQLQRPKKRRGRPCKEKMEIKTTVTRVPQGRPCKTKVLTDTSANELSSKHEEEESESQGKESVTDIDKGISEQENPEEAAGKTNEDHLQGRDMITSSAEQQQLLQTLKSSEGRITRSKLAGP